MSTLDRTLPGSLCAYCVSQRHTTEQHAQARANTCPGIDVRNLVNLSAHAAPVDCPGCEDCQPSLRPPFGAPMGRRASA